MSIDALSLRSVRQPSPPTRLQRIQSGLLRTIRTCIWCVRRVICAICRHDLKLAREGRRLFLECANCGMRTPGWR